jgi:hypothetical protein
MSVHPTLLAAVFGVASIASPGLARAQDDAHGFGEKPSQWFVVANGGAGGREVLTLSLQNGVVTGVGIGDRDGRSMTIRGEFAKGALILNSVEGSSGARCVYHLRPAPGLGFAGQRACANGSSPVSLNKAPQRS